MNADATRQPTHRDNRKIRVHSTFLQRMRLISILIAGTRQPPTRLGGEIFVAEPHATSSTSAQPSEMSSEPVFVVGVGMTKFNLAGKGKRDYPELGHEAAAAALKDAQVEYSDVQAAVAGYCYGDPTCGQRVVYNLGLSGVPVVNVNNNCSTASTALFMAREMVQGGRDCVLAVGFEKMKRQLSQVYADKGWSSPTERHFERFYD
jgi:hypothetical protein